MNYHARSVTSSVGPFRVSGGPLVGEQIMGWHITDERGFTVAVSCDAEFVKQATSPPQPVQAPALTWPDALVLAVALITLAAALGWMFWLQAWSAR